MERILDGTVALVTGASSGIGDATARSLADHGAAVALVARRKERLEQLSAEIKETGVQSIFIEADITKQSQAEIAVTQTITEFGRLDIVINNAGVLYPGRAEDSPVAEWEQMVYLNVLGLLYIAHVSLPHLLKGAKTSRRRVADMVNIGSTAGHVAHRGSAVYSLTKFGIHAFSESLRQEVADRHLRISVVAPGLVDTELFSHMRTEIQVKSAQRISGIEKLQPEDIAGAVSYIVTRPRHVAINEILIRPAEQKP